MTGLAVGRELGKGMIWICRGIKISQVTTCTVGGCPSRVAIGMTCCTQNGGMSSGQWEHRCAVVKR